MKKKRKRREGEIGERKGGGSEKEKEKAKMNGRGRVILRPSGTEPLVRVTLEGEDEEQISLLAHQLAEVVQKELG